MRLRASATMGRARLSRAVVTLGALTAALAVLLASASEAQAYPRVLRPGTRPWEVSIGFGPSIIGVEDRHPRALRQHVQFKMMQQIGGHFQGDSEGPALGGTLEEAFIHDIRFSAGCKFWWDIKIIDDLGLYLFPEAKAGFAIWTDPGHDIDPFFNVQAGFGGKLILDDRWMVFLKPITPDFYIGRHFVFAWDILLGGGVTF